MAIDYNALHFKKGQTRKQVKARAKRQQRQTTRDVRAYVFARERNICRCCRKRPATSMHEIVFRSQGGKISRHNSIAVCGDGTRGCHGFLQLHVIRVDARRRDAERNLLFVTTSGNAMDWLGIPLSTQFLSPPMADCESAE